MQDSVLWIQFEGLLLKQVTWTTGESANENNHVFATHFEDWNPAKKCTHFL